MLVKWQGSVTALDDFDLTYTPFLWSSPSSLLTLSLTLLRITQLSERSTRNEHCVRVGHLPLPVIQLFSRSCQAHADGLAGEALFRTLRSAAFSQSPLSLDISFSARSLGLTRDGHHSQATILLSLLFVFLPVLFLGPSFVLSPFIGFFSRQLASASIFTCSLIFLFSVVERRR